MVEKLRPPRIIERVSERTEQMRNWGVCHCERYLKKQRKGPGDRLNIKTSRAEQSYTQDLL